MAIERAFPGQLPGARGGLSATPFQFILSGEDNLRVTIYNARLGMNLRVQGRMLQEGVEGVQAFSYDILPTTTGLEFRRDFRLGAGVLLNVVVRCTTVAQRGDCFARLDIIRGFTGGGVTVLGTLLAGYITSAGGRAWPGTALEDPVDGRGVIKTYTLSAPGAGVMPSYSVPEETRWHVLGVSCILTTNAVAGTRNVRCRAYQRGNIVFTQESSYNHPPSAAVYHTFAAGLAHAQGVGVAGGYGGLPTWLYLSNWAPGDTKLDLYISNMAAGDAITDFTIWVEEWRNPVNQAAD